MPKKLLIALSLVVAVAASIYFYARHRATAVVNEQMVRLISSDVYDTAEYESLDLSLTGDLHLQNVRIGKDGVDVVVRDVNITNLDYAHEIPWHMDVEAKGIHFPNGLPPVSTLDSTPMATMLGELIEDDTIPLTLRYRYEYDADDSHSLVTSISTALPDQFILTMDSESRNVPLETMMALNSGNVPEDEVLSQVASLMSTLAIPQAKIVLEDQGVVDALITSVAAGNGMNPDDLRSQLQSQVRNYYLLLPQNAQGIAMQAGIQVAGFLEGGRTLSVAIAPEFGGSLAGLQQEAIGAVLVGDFKKIADLLHLEISAR